MSAMMQEQHQEQLNAMRESNAEAMKTANTAMVEMAKNMQIMMGHPQLYETTTGTVGM